MLVANQDSANVVVFAIDGETGALTPTGDVLEVEKPRCVKWATAGGAKM
jgi:6-phosphogluconolactonase